jgi:hypothetical protein
LKETFYSQSYCVANVSGKTKKSEAIESYGYLCLVFSLFSSAVINGLFYEPIQSPSLCRWSKPPAMRSAQSYARPFVSSKTLARITRRKWAVLTIAELATKPESQWPSPIL